MEHDLQPAADTDSATHVEELRQLVLRELVMRYLATNPGAMDTLDGIAEWWIMREQLRLDLERLSRVLDGLTTDGILEVVDVGGEKAYRLREHAALTREAQR